MIWLILALCAAAIAIGLREAEQQRRERQRFLDASLAGEEARREQWRRRVRERVKWRQRRPGESFIEWRMRVDSPDDVAYRAYCESCGVPVDTAEPDADADVMESGVVMHWPAQGQGRGPGKGKVQ
jgi:hypothetical protein